MIIRFLWVFLMSQMRTKHKTIWELAIAIARRITSCFPMEILSSGKKEWKWCVCSNYNKKEKITLLVKIY